MSSPYEIRIPYGEIGAAADHFEHILDIAKDERPIQAFLKDNRWVLANMHPHGYAVFSEFQFGSSYRADFVVLEGSSAGTFVELVELESPTAQLTTKDGQFAKSVRKGIAQVRDWEGWLDRNPRAIGDSRERGGLDIEKFSLIMKTVYVGRRANISEKFNELRNRDFESLGVSIRTYDRILSYLRRMAEAHDRQPRGPYSNVKPIT